MSIIIALVDANNGYIVTDSQRTNLQTGNAEHGFTKFQKITKKLLVGYGGHTDACEQIMEWAVKIHDAVHKESSSILEFIEDIKSGIQVLQLQRGSNCLNGLNYSFLIVGLNEAQRMDIMCFGTYTCFLPVRFDSHPNGVKVAFLPPDDISYQDCLKKYNLVINASKDSCNLATIGEQLVIEIADASQYCDNTVQILQTS